MTSWGVTPPPLNDIVTTFALCLILRLPLDRLTKKDPHNSPRTLVRHRGRSRTMTTLQKAAVPDLPTKNSLKDSVGMEGGRLGCSSSPYSFLRAAMYGSGGQGCTCSQCQGGSVWPGCQHLPWSGTSRGPPRCLAHTTSYSDEDQMPPNCLDIHIMSHVFCCCLKHKL